MSDAILCVDDELSILAGFQRQFRKQFNLVSALNGPHALEILAEKGPFAAVLSDYNMPGMNGLNFLRKVREQAPETVRLMLTGKVDSEAGLAAVNEGTLFRFLTKPCAPALLANTFTAALEQYRLVTAERFFEDQLIESSIGIMSEVQAHLQPKVVERGSRIAATVRDLVSLLNIADRGRFELAARLSHVGCVGISASILDQFLNGASLSPDEKSAFMKHAEIGGQMIRKIPGLALVAPMVGRQFEVQKLNVEESLRQTDPILLGSQLLRLAATLDSHLLSGLTYFDALNNMSHGPEPHDPDLLSALKTTTKDAAARHRRVTFLGAAKVGMVVPDNFVTCDGLLLASKGAIISPELLAELQQHAAAGDIDFSV